VREVLSEKIQPAGLVSPDKKEFGFVVDVQKMESRATNRKGLGRKTLYGGGRKEPAGPEVSQVQQAGLGKNILEKRGHEYKLDRKDRLGEPASNKSRKRGKKSPWGEERRTGARQRGPQGRGSIFEEGKCSLCRVNI